MNLKIIVFANTLWFIEKFKFQLINNLSQNNKIECLYFKEGPPFNKKKIDKLIKKKIKFTKLNLLNFIFSFLSNLHMTKIKKIEY